MTRRIGVAAAVLLAMVVLCGCRGVGQAARSDSGAGHAPAPGASSAAVQPAGNGSSGRPEAGSSADLEGVNQDLAGIDAANSSIGSDLSGAAADASTPDNG